jgi:hypothetical protein
MQYYAEYIVTIRYGFYRTCVPQENPRARDRQEGEWCDAVASSKKRCPVNALKTLSRTAR